MHTVILMLYLQSYLLSTQRHVCTSLTSPSLEHRYPQCTRTSEIHVHDIHVNFMYTLHTDFTVRSFFFVYKLLYKYSRLH